MDLRSFNKDTSIIRHDALMPGFAKTNMNTRLVSKQEKQINKMSKKL